MHLESPSPRWGSLQEIAAGQEALLRRHLEHCKRNSPYYQSLLAGIQPGEFSLDSLAQLPLTDKTAFARHNREFLAVAPEAVVDIVLTSGITGKATPVMYTEHDLQRLALNEALSFAGCGVGRGSVALLTCTMDRCFIAGMAYQIGLRKLGAAVIRNGASTLQSHLEIICNLHPTLLVGVPSFLRKLGRFAREQGVKSTSVRQLVCIGEPLRDGEMGSLEMTGELEALWQAPAYSTYASSETVSTFCECTARNGGHLHPELAIVEIVDEAGNRLGPGQHGEVVITPLQTEGMPLLRFRTGDVSFLMDQPCECGRITPRLGPILGRKNQMLKTKGTTIYPLGIFAALNSIPEVVEYYAVATNADSLSDQITVHAAVSGPNCSGESISRELQARLRVKTNVIIETEAAVSRQVFNGGASRKAIRFVDRRVNS